MTWEVWSSNILTGAKGVLLTDVVTRREPQSVLNGYGQGTYEFQVVGSGIDKAEWKNVLLRPRARKIVQCWDGTPLFQGVILDLEFNWETGRVTVNTVELPFLAAERLGFTVGNYASGSYSVSNKDLAGLIRAAYSLAFYQPHGTIPPGPLWQLPVLFPPDSSGSESRDWPNHMLSTVEEMVEQERDSDQAPDTYFRSVLNDGGFWWELQLGTPRLSNGVVEFHPNAPESDAQMKTARFDATNQATGAFVAGQGAEDLLPVAQVSLADIGLTDADVSIPYADVVVHHPDESDVGRLSELGKAFLRANVNPLDEVPFTVKITDTTPVTQIVPGARAKLHFIDDPWMDDGWTERYVTGVSVDSDDLITVETSKVS